MNRSKWTDAEVQLLKELFPVTATEDLLPLLPSHPLRSINSKANEMGLRKTDEYRKQYLAVNRVNAIKALQGATPWNKKAPIQKVCEICNTPFEVRPFRDETARFCSKECVHQWLETTRGETHWHYRLVDRTCKWCGKVFKCKPAVVGYGKGLFCSNSCLGSFSTQSQGGRRSSLEIAIEQVLIALNEPFESQAKIGRWNVDFYLPERNLVIECDGKYWHSLEAVIERDERKDQWLNKNGYAILRLGEDAIRKDATQALTDGLQDK